MKSDLSIHKITIAAIKRHTIAPYDFSKTKFYEEQSLDSKFVNNMELEKDELIICSVIVNESQWTVLTTRRIITSDNSSTFIQKLEDFSSRHFENFKGIGGNEIEKGYIGLKDGSRCPCFIETGKASMVIIYGIMTAMRLID